MKSPQAFSYSLAKDIGKSRPPAQPIVIYPSSSEPMVHAHITCGREDFSIIGGHLGEGICSLTVELFVDILDGELVKKTDPKLKINTIEF